MDLERVLEAWPALRGAQPEAWATFARALLDRGRAAEAAALALAALDDPRCGRRARLIAGAALSAGVPDWHWALVRDGARNAAYAAALARAVGPDSLVLDIGAGTGLLGLLALRAGAGRVVACESNPAAARMAAEIARANGVADRLRIVAKRSQDLKVGVDLERPADLIVSEIVDNVLLGEGVLATHRDAVPRLLRPGGRVIPGVGAIMVALGHDPVLARRRMATHEGFDLSAFNRLASPTHRLPVGTPGLRLLTAPAALFRFAFGTPDAWPGRRAAVAVTATEAGAANAILQWIRLDLDASGDAGVVLEVAPGPGRISSWAVMSWPLPASLTVTAGQVLDIAGERTDDRVMIWCAD